MKEKKETLRAIYLYTVSIVTLIMLVAGIIGFTSGILNIVFRQVSEESLANHIQSIVRDASLIGVGGVMFIYHWRIISRERRARKEVKQNEQRKV